VVLQLLIMLMMSWMTAHRPQFSVGWVCSLSQVPFSRELTAHSFLIF